MNSLDQTIKDNATLQQRLTNSLSSQRNLERELKQLNNEKKLLEAENKNLAFKIAPYVDENGKIDSKGYGSFKQDGKLSYQSFVDEDVINNNIKADGKIRRTSTKRSNSRYRYSSRTSSMAGLSSRWDTNDEEPESATITQSESNLTIDSTIEDIKQDYSISRREARRKAKTNHGLQEIQKYLGWKTKDFNKLHENLYKRELKVKQHTFIIPIFIHTSKLKNRSRGAQRSKGENAKTVRGKG